MMKPLTSLLSLALIGLLEISHAASVDLPVYGFEMDALEAPVGQTPVSALMTFLPVTDGFAPNINVQIQPYSGTIKEYAELSRGQFAGMQWKVVSEKQVGDNEWIAEYTGPMQGNVLRFYARAIAKGGKVYLATGTTKESQWPTLGTTIRKHVDSFKVK